jgi:hypothetical protein
MKYLAAVLLALRAGVAQAQQPDPLADLLKEADLAFSKGDYEGARQAFEKALATVGTKRYLRATRLVLRTPRANLRARKRL